MTHPHGLLVLIGGGGHALVVAEAARLTGSSLAGFLDDNPRALMSHGELQVIHLGFLSDPSTVERVLRHGDPWILALGNLHLRRRLLAECLWAQRSAPANVVHPTAFVSPLASLGNGTFVGPRAVVHTRATLGDHVIVNTGAIVEHECVVGDNVHLAPGVILGGNNRIGDDSLIGLGARTLPGIIIGRGATVGAASLVTRDVADHETVMGIPARAALRRHKGS